MKNNEKFDEKNDKKNDKKFKRIIVDLPIKSHVDIKTRASFRNVTIKKWVMYAIARHIIFEEQYEERKKNKNENTPETNKGNDNKPSEST